MGKAIGIDLGTTNSVAAFKKADVEVITAEDNSPPDRVLTRSAVYNDDKHQFIVGESAWNAIRSTPENVVYSIKRLMGRGFNTEAVSKQTGKVGYKITKPSEGTEDAVAVWIAGKEYLPEDISAEILKKVVQNTQRYFKATGAVEGVINQAVITVPAYFDDQQKSATRTAAFRAGITPLELLAEPTAAAISFGYSPDADDVKTILVYDFGGGTFDASVITAAGTQFIENGKAGDLWLGGDDIDTTLTQYSLQQVAQKENIDDINALIIAMPLYQQKKFKASLKVKVERAKILLSSYEEAKIILGEDETLVDEFGPIPFETVIQREQLETLISPLVDRTIQICHKALHLSEYPPDMVDVVLLVGGSSQIPYVQQRLQQAFGVEKVKVHPRPMTGVAEGAAIVASGIVDKHTELDKVTTVGRDYCVKLQDGRLKKVIDKSQNLPVKEIVTFQTVSNNQKLILFELYSPDIVKKDIDHVTPDELQGRLWMSLEENYPSGTEILTYFEIDEGDTCVRLTATLKSDPSIKVSAEVTRGSQDAKAYEQLQVAIDKLNQLGLTRWGIENAEAQAQEVVKYANRIIDNKNTSREVRSDMVKQTESRLNELETSMSEDCLTAKSYISDFTLILKFCSFMIPELQQARLHRITEELQHAINESNLSMIQVINEEASQEYKVLPDSVHYIFLIRSAISRAIEAQSSDASTMQVKLNQILHELEIGSTEQALKLMQELDPYVKRWLDSNVPDQVIQTGLTT